MTKAAAKVLEVRLETITVLPGRLRKFRLKEVEHLAETMAVPGLIQPISVRPGPGDGFILVVGRTRLETARRLGWETIPANVWEGLTDDEARLMEIDENLVRAELTPAERGVHEALRKEIHDRLNPVRGRGGDRRSADRVSNPQIEDLKERYTLRASRETGRSEASIQRDVYRGTAIPDLGSLIDTSLDKGQELDALIKLSQENPETAKKLMPDLDTAFY